MLELIINKNEDLENIILLKNGKIIEYYTSTEEDRKRRLEGIAISLPGQVDVDNGICYAGGALPYLDKAHISELVSERCDGLDRKSTRLNSSHITPSRMPSSA